MRNLELDRGQDGNGHHPWLRVQSTLECSIASPVLPKQRQGWPRRCRSIELGDPKKSPRPSYFFRGTRRRSSPVPRTSSTAARPPDNVLRSELVGRPVRFNL